MVATSDFSGLASSTWALARAAAMAPIDSLERCMAGLQFEQVEADGARFRALSADAMSDCLFGILGHEALQFDLGVLMLQKCGSGLAKDCGEFRPGIGRTHIDDANGLDAGSRRLGKEQSRGLAALEATPELLLGCQK